MNTTDTPQDKVAGAYDPFNRERSLRRLDGPVAGVASGLADYMNIDANLMRVLFGLAALTTGPGALVAYGAAWALMPANGETESPVDRMLGSKATVGGAA